MRRRRIGILRDAVPKRPVFARRLDQVDEHIFLAKTLLLGEKLSDGFKERFLQLDGIICLSVWENADFDVFGFSNEEPPVSKPVKRLDSLVFSETQPIVLFGGGAIDLFSLLPTFARLSLGKWSLAALRSVMIKAV